MEKKWLIISYDNSIQPKGRTARGLAERFIKEQGDSKANYWIEEEGDICTIFSSLPPSGTCFVAPYDPETYEEWHDMCSPSRREVYK